MPDRFQELLQATIQHVENQKALGVKFLPVSRETLDALAAPCVPEYDAAPPQALRAGGAGVAPPLTRAESSPPASPGTVSMDLPAKQAAMAELRARALVCQKCPHLAASRKNVVFGVGDIRSPLMFVGEAPGADEDQQGEPFVG